MDSGTLISESLLSFSSHFTSVSLFLSLGLLLLLLLLLLFLRCDSDDSDFSVPRFSPLSLIRPRSFGHIMGLMVS